MTNPTPLSPAAQAVLNAYRDLSWTPDEEDNGRYYKFSHRAGMAAALRTAADHVYHDWSGFNCVDYLCEIAAELEGADQVVPPALEDEFNDRIQALLLTKMVEIHQKLNAIARELDT